MILVTGASGKTGKTIIRHLVKRYPDIRALVHYPAQQAELSLLGIHDIHFGDMRAPEVLAKAFNGIETIYHICPNMTQDEVEIGQRVIQTASQQGVRRIIYHSVLHPQTSAMPHHWNKLKVEEAIFASGLKYIILQPTAYMQNISSYWQKIIAEGVYALPYSADSRLSMVDLEDVAAAVVNIILDSAFDQGTFELVGTQALSQQEVARIIAGKIGRSVRVETISHSDWEANSRQSGLGEYAIHTLLDMFEYYQTVGLEGNTKVLNWILGRSPVSFPDFIDRIMAK